MTSTDLMSAAAASFFLWAAALSSCFARSASSRMRSFSCIHRFDGSSKARFCHIQGNYCLIWCAIDEAQDPLQVARLGERPMHMQIGLRGEPTPHSKDSPPPAFLPPASSAAHAPPAALPAWRPPASASQHLPLPWPMHQGCIISCPLITDHLYCSWHAGLCGLLACHAIKHVIKNQSACRLAQSQ